MSDAMRVKIAEIVQQTSVTERGFIGLNGKQAGRTASAIISALPDMVPPLEWEDFDGRGAKSTAWGKANYLITRWSDGRFELVESYPGYQGDNLAGGFSPTLESAKAAANAHHRTQIMAALGIGASHD